MNLLMTLSGADIGEDTEMPTHLIGDVQPPDTVQGTLTMSVNGVDVETQVVRVDGTTYVTNPLTNKWMIDGTTPTQPREVQER